MNGERIKNKWFGILWIAIIIFACAITYGYYRPYDFNFKSIEALNIFEPPTIEILMVGDIMLDRNVRNIIDKKGFDYFFKGVKDLVRDADIAVGNLEGTFTTYPS